MIGSIQVNSVEHIMYDWKSDFTSVCSSSIEIQHRIHAFLSTIFDWKVKWVTRNLIERTAIAIFAYTSPSSSNNRLGHGVVTVYTHERNCKRLLFFTWSSLPGAMARSALVGTSSTFQQTFS